VCGCLSPEQTQAAFEQEFLRPLPRIERYRFCNRIFVQNLEKWDGPEMPYGTIRNSEGGTPGNALWSAN